MNGFMVMVALLLIGAGLGLIFAPARVFHRNGLRAPQTRGDRRVYLIGGLTLLALATYLIILLASE